MITGGAARKAITGTSGLAADISALLAMGKTLALKLASIRVNIISSELVGTPAYVWMGQEQKRLFILKRQVNSNWKSCSTRRISSCD